MARLYGREVQTQLAAFLEREEPEVIDAALSTWDLQRGAFDIGALTVMAQEGTLPERPVDRLAEINGSLVRSRLAPKWRAASTFTYNIVNAGALNALGTPIPFRATLVRVDRWIATRSGRLITSFNRAQLRAVRDTLRYYTVVDPLGATELGAVIRPIVGLDRRFAKAVQSLRTRLIEVEGLSRSAANAEATAYARRLEGVRAQRIARTELAEALNAGQVESVRAGVDTGALDPDVMKEWLTSQDERVDCKVCKPLDGKEIPMEDKFRSGGKEADHPPIHVSCRCTLTFDASAPVTE